MIKKILFCILFGSLLLSGFAYSQFSFAAFLFSDEFGSQGNNDDEFDSLTDLAISNDGKKLYVVDSENNRIKMYDLTGGSNCPSGTDEIINDEVCFVDDFGISGSTNGRFDIPTDLAIDKGNGDIYVVDSDNNRVQRFQADGDYDNLEFGSSSNSDDEYLGSPSAIAIHKETDYIYVADSATDSISVFDDNGKFKFNFDDDDSGDEFKNPSGMVIDDSNDILYVADTGNNRIRIYELTDGDNCPSGTDEVINDEVCFVDDFGISGSTNGRFDEPAGLAFDEDNDLLYVADTENNRIQVFEIVAGNTCPSGTDEIIDGVCFVEEFGSSGSTNGKFNSPSGLALDMTNDLLYVADTDNHRVQIIALPANNNSNGSSSSSSSKDIPDSPKSLSVSAASPTSIIVTWNSPELDDDVSKITGYKIESREGSGSYTTIVADTKSTTTSFLHTGLDEDTNYRYKVYAINSEGVSSPSSTGSAKPGPTQTPAGLTATPISKNQILLSWIPPTDTFKQAITGYAIEREVIAGILYDDVATVSGSTTTYTVNGLGTGKTYSYVVSANLAIGNTPRSITASATPEEDSKPPTSSVSVTVPNSPRSLSATASSSQIQLSWNQPSSDGNSKIIGYRIDVKKDSGSYSVLKSNTKSTTTSYVDTNVQIDSKYTYKVYTINSVGISIASSESSSTPKKATLQISPLGKFTINEKKTLSFTVKTTDSSLDNVIFTLSNHPAGAKINSSTGLFTWTPTDSQGAKSYVLDIIAKNDSMSDKQSVTITVNDVKSEPVKQPEPKITEPKPKITEHEELGLASFVDESKDPQSYVERYNTEASYKKWFDDNYSEYSSIYEAVGLEKPVEIPAFIDPNQDPQYYVERYNTEASYKKWFDDNYSEYSSIYEVVGLEEPKLEEKNSEESQIQEKKFGICGSGTKLIDGVCTLVKQPNVKPWWQFW